MYQISQAVNLLDEEEPFRLKEMDFTVGIQGLCVSYYFDYATQEGWSSNFNFDLTELFYV